MSFRYDGLLVACGLLCLGAGCGDDGGDGGAGGAGTTTAATTSALSSTSSGSSSMCIQPGDVGNDIGVGHYCTPGGGECSQFPLASLCLADVGQDEWFCTRIQCDASTNCGSKGGCLLDPQGSACVLCACDDSAFGCNGGTSSSSGSGSSSASTSVSGSSASGG